MDLYIDETGVYYCPNGDGNARLAADPAGDLWAVAGVVRVDPLIVETASGRSPARFAEWAGSTGDVMDAVVRLKGPFTRVTIAQDGKTVTAAVSRTASQHLFIDVTEFTAWTGGANAWEPTASRVALDYGAGGALTALSPGPDGVEVSVSGDGLTSASTVTLRGRRWWL